MELGTELFVLLDKNARGTVEASRGTWGAGGLAPELSAEGWSGVHGPTPAVQCYPSWCPPITPLSQVSELVSVHGGRWGGDASAMFGAVDTDGDGRLTVHEWRSCLGRVITKGGGDAAGYFIRHMLRRAQLMGSDEEEREAASGGGGRGMPACGAPLPLCPYCLPYR